MLTFLVWCVVLFFCWPLALVALILYPLVWLLLLPFRIVGIAVGGALDLVWAIVTLPAGAATAFLAAAAISQLLEFPAKRSRWAWPNESTN